MTHDGLIGYQQRVDWMGAEVLTLSDLWPRDVRAMIVGVNPAPKSVEIGHYYQGRFGKRQLGRLVEYGLFRAPSGAGYFEEAALAGGVGFLDLVKRPTVKAKGPSNAEKVHGRTVLLRALAERDVPLVICVFSDPVAALIGTIGSLGYQKERTSWGARVFRMPGPTEKLEKVQAVMETLNAR